MKLILPKMFVDNASIIHPLFFLAGPVLGGGNWQEKCCLEIAKRIPEFFAVIPCRWSPADKLFCHRVREAERNTLVRQTDWERHYLAMANSLSIDHQGCIIFWLPVESKDHPRIDGQPYARDTYGELGRWGREAAFKKTRIVVGAEADFPGLSQIRRNLELDFKNGVEFQIYPTLEKTVEQAVQWVGIGSNHL